MDDTTFVSTLRRQMAGFVADRDWGKFHSPKNLAMALAVEAAELMEHFLWIDTDASRAAVQDPATRAAVADEVADVMCLLLAMANALDLDLSDTVNRKMARNVVKYPAARCRGHYRVRE